MKNSIRHWLVAASLAVVSLTPSKLLGQDRDSSGVVFTIEGFGILAENLPDRVGVFKEFSDSLNTDLDPSVYYYDYRTRPLKLPNRFNRGIRVAIRYRTFELSFLAFDADRFIGGTLESTPRTVSWIEMWGANPFPVRNDEEESGFSPVEYGASDNLLVSVAQFAKERSLSHNLRLYTGLRVARLRYELAIGQSQRAVGGNYEDNITRKTDGDARSTLIGPVVGFSFTESFNDFLSFEAEFRQSMLYSLGNYRGAFTDIDEVTLGSAGAYVLDGGVDFEESLTSWVSGTDIAARTVFGSGSVRLRVGLNLFLLRNVPLAPIFLRPWSIENRAEGPSGLEWEIRRHTVGLGSITFGMEKSF